MKLQECKHAAPASAAEQIQIRWQQWQRGRWYERTTTLDSTELLALCVELELDPIDLLYPANENGALYQSAVQAARKILDYQDEPRDRGYRVEHVALLVSGRWQKWSQSLPKHERLT